MHESPAVKAGLPMHESPVAPGKAPVAPGIARYVTKSASDGRAQVDMDGA